MTQVRLTVMSISLGRRPAAGPCGTGRGGRAGVPGPQHDSQRLTRAFRAVISEDGQRVMAFSEQSTSS